MQNTLSLLYTTHQIQQQELLDYLSGRCEEILTTNSSARAIVAGDIIPQFRIFAFKTIYYNWLLNQKKHKKSIYD